MLITIDRTKEDNLNTVLSKASLGIPRKVARKKVRDEWSDVTKKWDVRWDRSKRYKLLCRPVTRWFPSRMASFSFGVLRTAEPQWFFNLVSDDYLPSIWKNKRKACYTIRVAKKFEEKVRKILYRKGYWFNTKDNLWYKRLRKQHRQGHSVTLRAKEEV